MKKLAVFLAFLWMAMTSHAQTFSGNSGGDIFVVPPYRFCLGPDNGQNGCFLQVGNQQVLFRGQLDFALTAKTVSTLPAAASNAGRVYRVTDGQSNSDCTTGSGTTSSICFSDGNTWNTLGGSGGGSNPAGSVGDLQAKASLSSLGASHIRDTGAQLNATEPLAITPLAGSGNRCVDVDSTGLTHALSFDCGTGGNNPSGNVGDIQTKSGASSFGASHINDSGSSISVTEDAHFKTGVPWYDVMAYGAVGDGVTIDTTAVASAYTAACTNGGTVLFPANHTFKFAWPSLSTCTGWVTFKFDGILSPTNTLVINKPQTAVWGTGQSSENGFFNQFPNSFITPGTNSPVISVTTASANPVVIYGVGMDGCTGDCVAVTNGSTNVRIENSILRTSLSSTGSPVDIDMTATSGGFNFWMDHDSLVQQSTGPSIKLVATGLTYIKDSFISGRTISASNVGAGSGVGQVVVQRMLAENLVDPAFITFNTTAGSYTQTTLENIEIADNAGGGSYLASNTGGTLKVSVKASRGFSSAIFNEISGVVVALVDDEDGYNLGNVSQNNDAVIDFSKGLVTVPTAGSVFGDFVSGVTNTTLTVRPVQSAKVAETIKAQGGQTGDLLDFMDSGGTVRAKVDSSYNLTTPGDIIGNSFQLNGSAVFNLQAPGGTCASGSTFPFGLMVGDTVGGIMIWDTLSGTCRTVLSLTSNLVNGNIPVASGTRTEADSGVAAASGHITLLPTAFASLPTCNAGAEGMEISVNNSNTATWGATISGTGSNHVLGYCDGTNWTVAGK